MSYRGRSDQPHISDSAEKYIHDDSGYGPGHHVSPHQGMVMSRELAQEMGEDKEGEEVWEGYNFLRRIKSTIDGGPHWKLDKYLGAIDLLLEAKFLFERSESRQGQVQSQELIDTAMADLGKEFRMVLQTHSHDGAERLSADNLRALAGRMGGNSSEVGSPSQSPDRASHDSRQERPSMSAATSSVTSAASSPRSPRLRLPPFRDGVLGAAAPAEVLPAKDIPWLQKMVKRMEACGAGRTCADIYCSVRSECLRPSLQGLGVKEVAVGAFDAMPWREQETAMKRWTNEITIVVKLLLVAERQLCMKVLQDLHDDREWCFLELVRLSGGADCMGTLARSARAIAAGRRSPEQLFGLLDMYHTVTTMLPEVNTVFAAPDGAHLRAEMHEVPGALAEAVMGTFDRLRELLEDTGGSSPSQLRRSSSRFSWKQAAAAEVEEMPAGGGLHELTSYVIQYTRQYLDRHRQRSYLHTLERLFRDYGQLRVDDPGGAAGTAGAAGSGGATPGGGLPDAGVRLLEQKTGKLITSLRNCLKEKSLLYNNDVLAELFMLNNSYYIYTRLQDCKDLLMAVGEVQNDRFVEFHATTFRNLALAKVALALSPPQAGVTKTGSGRLLFSSKVADDALQRLRRFNAAFEELERQQQEWRVVDADLAEKLRVKWSSRLREKYTEFLEPRREELTRNNKLYVYTPEALEQRVKATFFTSRRPAEAGSR